LTMIDARERAGGETGGKATAMDKHDNEKGKER
jgi:hypothetical protein